VCTSKALLLFIFRISQGSVVTHLRRGAKYDTSLVANLLLSPAVKEFFFKLAIFLKVMNEYRLARFYGAPCSCVDDCHVTSTCTSSALHDDVLFVSYSGNSRGIRQEAQLSQRGRGRAMLRVIEYFPASLRAIQDHLKLHL